MPTVLNFDMTSSPTLRLLSILPVVVSFSVATLAGASKSARFDDLLSQNQKAGFLNGVVLVAEHGTIIYVKGFGEADMNTGGECHGEKLGLPTGADFFLSIRQYIASHEETFVNGPTTAADFLASRKKK
jgi:hypothetical protein